MENELYHYGSLGMRWGLRRYQNYDGSLTEEGKQRYGKNIEKHYGKARKKLNKYKNKQLKSENKALKYDKKSLKQIEKAEKYADKKLRGNAPDSKVASRLAKYDMMREKADFYENTSFGWKDKAETYKQKGEKWAEKMDEVFEKEEIYLQHHGILGQKWGVRRFQNPDGSLTTEGKIRYLKNFSEIGVIKKGQTLYRSTTDKNESVNGNKYVTFFPEDTSFYDNEGAVWIGTTQNKNKVYRKSYKVNRDIKIATTDDINNIIERLNKKQNLRVQAGKSAAEFYLSNQGYNKIDILDILYKYKDKGVKKMTDKEKNKIIGDELINNKLFTEKEQDIIIDNVLSYYKNGFNYANDIINNSNSQHSKLFGYTLGLGTKTGSKMKELIIQELKNEGFDGMTDIAGIGGVQGSAREARQPLILFENSNDPPIKEKLLTNKKVAYKDYAGRWETKDGRDSLNRSWRNSRSYRYVGDEMQSPSSWDDFNSAMKKLGYSNFYELNDSQKRNVYKIIKKENN